MKKIGIYKITNKINNKCYIGQSVDIFSRWTHEKYRAFNPKFPDYGYALSKAFRKYGLENFTFEIIEECKEEELSEKEKYWIWYYGSYGLHNGYNMTPGGEAGPAKKGENSYNHILTEEDVVKIRQAYKKNKNRLDVYKDYCDRITLSGFENIWYGLCWKHIMPEIYENRVSKFHGKGENNPNVKVTEEDVKEIRKRKLNGEQRKNVYADYADKLTLSGFQKIWYYKTWKDIK